MLEINFLIDILSDYAELINHLSEQKRTVSTFAPEWIGSFIIVATIGVELLDLRLMPGAYT